MPVEGNKSFIVEENNHKCRVEIKLTQTNDIGMLLNAINTIEISKFILKLLTKYLQMEKLTSKMQLKSLN